MPEQLANDFAARLASAESDLRAITELEATETYKADAWTRKQVLGHLIDSAANNHQRIVRAALNAALDFPPYQQNAWVEIQRYNEPCWFDLVDLFVLNNLHLCRVIDGLPEEALNNPCSIGRAEPVTLQFVIDDYLRHLKLHIAQILEPAGQQEI